jgi:hypothetical protein
MKRKNLQQYRTLKSAVKKADTSSVVPFSTAEGTLNEKLEHLVLELVLHPIYAVLMPQCTCVALGPFVNMPDFQLLKKAMLFTEEI